MSDRLLGQEEIDALLSRGLEEHEPAGEPGDLLSREDMDALGEIGNISMGSAATTLSQILSRKVTITSPSVRTVTREQLFAEFVIPHLLIQVDFTQGLEGTTLLVMDTKSSAILADLMMGGDGTDPSPELDELQVSAASEAMNQMLGTACTSMATLFRRTVNISPPVTRTVTTRELEGQPPLEEEQLVVIDFNIKVEDLIDNTIMQIMTIETARTEAALLWQDVESINSEAPPQPAEVPAEPARVSPKRAPPEPARVSPEPEPPRRSEPVAPVTPAPRAPAPESRVFRPLADAVVDQSKLEMILDIPLEVSVILGRTRQPVKDVLNLTPGVVMGLDMTVDEPVEILVNGTLVAKGEVVVVDENFGVRITSILSPVERLQHLRR